MSELVQEQRHRVVSAIGNLQNRVAQVDPGALPGGMDIVLAGSMAEVHEHSMWICQGWRHVALVRSGETVASLHRLLPRLRRLREDGAVVRAVFDVDSLTAPAHYQVLAEGYRGFVLSFAPLTMTIGDGRSVLIMRETATDTWALLSFTSPVVLTAALEYWNAAATVPAPGVMAGPRQEASTLTDRQISILQMLSAGRTDGQIATRLQISVRTVRADLRAAMTHFGATSRFEAGCAFTADALRLG